MTDELATRVIEMQIQANNSEVQYLNEDGIKETVREVPAQAAAPAPVAAPAEEKKVGEQLEYAGGDVIAFH